jgi:hypothetical protein
MQGWVLGSVSVKFDLGLLTQGGASFGELFSVTVSSNEAQGILI